MSQDFSSAIAALNVQLAKQEREVRETKRLINKLSAMDSAPLPHPNAELDTDEGGTLGALRRDQFYGVPLATAIRDYLKMRRSSGAGPATVNDIYGALLQGGFKFDTKNEANAKRGLYISLAKNAAVFHKLPGGSSDAAAVFGLTEWYPNAKAEEKARTKPKVRRQPKKKAATDKSEAPKASSHKQLPREATNPDV
ncbi:MAG: hypothetical protein H7Y88_12930 [Phycisphaerales bacterium]|nr:hypothetical protein [Phycisphaerales bacterium]